MQKIIEKLTLGQRVTDEDLALLIDSEEATEPLREAADHVRRTHYGTDVYIRGLIEITNYCKNNCLYCGIRAGNSCAERYRLSDEEIFSSARAGYELGFRTFVMQGGEDPHFTRERLVFIIRELKKNYPDCAVTLSLGEWDRESYQAFFDAGADRYLLRHETADDAHYASLHPENLTFQTRKECLFTLKEIGFQVGAGFMVGSPHQTTQNLIKDLRFMEELGPAMIGIGPFLSHKDTPFRDEPNGELFRTLRMVSLARLLFPKALIPSTTALGTLSPEGRILGLRSGANVVMPNLSPGDVRKKYTLYDNKIYSGSEAAESKELLVKEIEEAGYQVVTARGDALDYRKE